MDDLNYSLKKMLERNRDGSFATQYGRERNLTLIAKTLRAQGYRHLTPAGLKPKHVTALVDLWKKENLSPGTIKNRMAALRWWAEKIGKPNIVARSNDHYGIERRVHVTNVSKARELMTEELARITDYCSRLSLRFQAEFGLRREESIKVQPVWADRGNWLALKDSWTKGGKYREIPILTVSQRALLDEAKQYVGKGSLIPADMRYVDQLHRFDHQCDKAGINHVHGHRHAYAQRRYFELTGWQCPALGGPKSHELTPAQKAIDSAARLQISAELGHGREQITAVYLGR